MSVATYEAAAAVQMTVHASLDGWPVDLALSLAPARLGAALRRLEALGYQPRAAVAPVTPAARSEGPPCCPYHGTAKIKESERRPGTYYCSAKMGDGSYCREKPV
jgi:hypothetical protein